MQQPTQHTGNHHHTTTSHNDDGDDGSVVVDTSMHATHTAADSSSSSSHGSLGPAAAVDQHALEAAGAPKFVNGELVDSEEAHPDSSSGSNKQQQGSHGDAAAAAPQAQGLYALVSEVAILRERFEGLSFCRGRVPGGPAL